MNRNVIRCGLPLAALVAILPARALAHGDEDHGAAAAPMTQAVLPRTEASTELFELVGVLEAGRLVIYLDRQGSNEPVEKATVEVEGAGLAAKATENAPGVYAVTLKQALPAGRHALNFTVQAGDDADLLASTIELSSPDAAVAVAGVSPYRWPWIAGAGALSAAGLGVVVLRRRKAAPPTARSAA
ncbi:MAG TPA: hypothetical protein PL196_02620 [Burkholderiaceae bacterium]|nr:hypothetical protein [Burkholderiaceae bacterium]